jgi:hypothetical protein
MIHPLTTAEVVAALNSLTGDDMARARASLARGDSQDRGPTPAPSSYADRMAEIEAAAARDDRPASYFELRDHDTA